MAQTINTNILSLNAQRNLNTSQAALATAMQRLSSGLRVNSAKDDAAGLAISERFTTQIRGFNQAIRNANDGISLSQVGEGALAELTSNLQRIRELAVQAANATNSDSDRAALDLEVQQRLEEIDRISAQTTFNGRKLLDGSFGSSVFQVGPDAGQTISLDLPDSSRTRAIGKIATMTTTGLGSNASGGNLSLAGISNLDFSDVNPNASVDGGVTLTAGTYLFGTDTFPGVNGSAEVTPISVVTDFTGAQVNGIAVMSTTDFDYSGAGLAQFDVTIDGQTIGITLTGNYGSLSGVADAIDDQLELALDGAFTVANPYANIVDGEIVITSSTTTAPTVTNFDANATTAGFTSSYQTLPGAVTNATTFTVDSIPVTLNTNTYVDEDGVAAAIQAQLGVGYSVTWDGSAYDIVNNTVGSTAPQLVATSAAAYLQGFDSATNAGIAEVVGQAATTSNEAKFVVDGDEVILTKNFTDFEQLRSFVDSELGATYNVQLVNGNQLRITNVDGSGNPLAVNVTASGDAAAAAVASATGFGPTAGALTNAATFKVDGTLVKLDTTNTSGNLTLDDLAADIEDQLTGYTVTAVDTNGDTVTDTLEFVNTTLGSAAVVISDANNNAIGAGISDQQGLAGTASGSITIADGDMLIAIGSADAIEIKGTFASVKELAETINREISGVAAEVVNGELRLISAQEITLSGNDPLLATPFASTTAEVDNGSLDTVNVTSFRDANETIVRIDAALTYVSNLRSTFGAIQNRFESVISNLSTAAENLSASRSRIIDADFAQETAALSRAQILQQAGTAMVAQANQVPQGVLQLLQG